MKNQTPKFAIYARQSKFKERGESVENQISICRDYIKGVMQITCEEDDITVFSEKDVSGKSTANRPEFQKMYKLLEDGTYNYLVCYQLDRVTRNVVDFSSILKLIQNGRIEFISVKEHFDTTSPAGRCLLNVCAAFAQMERETIAERVRDNMHLLAKTGRFLGGNTPFGFDVVSGEKIIVNGETNKVSLLKQNKNIETIKYIFSSFLELGSLSAVARRLIKAGLHFEDGRLISPHATRRILKNPVYCTADKDSYNYFVVHGSDVCFGEQDLEKGLGISCYNRLLCVGDKTVRNDISKWTIAVGRHKGTISGKDWITVQNFFKKGKTTSRNRKAPCLLSGLIPCPNCERSLSIKTSSTERKSYYYVCHNRDCFGKECCDSHYLNYKPLDDFVVNYIMEYDVSKLQKTLNTNQIDLKMFAIQKSISDLENEIVSEKQAQTMYLDKLIIGSISPELRPLMEERIKGIKKKSEQMQEELKNKKAELKVVNAERLSSQQIIDNLKKFKATFHKLDTPSKKSLLRLVVDKISWDGTNLKIKLLGE